MDDATVTIVRWLAEDGIHALAQHSHAACALLTDTRQVAELNRFVREDPCDWIDGVIGWPNDEWIIGTDGRGGYYLVSRSGAYEGVRYYDHELMGIEDHYPSLREFYLYCLTTQG